MQAGKANHIVHAHQDAKKLIDFETLIERADHIICCPTSETITYLSGFLSTCCIIQFKTDLIVKESVSNLYGLAFFHTLIVFLHGIMSSSQNIGWDNISFKNKLASQLTHISTVTTLFNSA